MDTMLSLMICGHCLLIHSNFILELVLCKEGIIRQLSTHRSLEPQLPLGLTSCHLPTSLEWVPSHLLPQLDLTSLFLLMTSDLHDFFCMYVFVFCDWLLRVELLDHIVSLIRNSQTPFTTFSWLYDFTGPPAMVRGSSNAPHHYHLELSGTFIVVTVVDIKWELILVLFCISTANMMLNIFLFVHWPLIQLLSLSFSFNNCVFYFFLTDLLSFNIVNFAYRF